MTTDDGGRTLGASMRRIGWVAIFCAIPVLTVDGRSLLAGPLAVVLAVLVWRLGGSAPGARGRGALQLTSVLAALVAAASAASWIDGVDLAGSAWLAGVAMAAGGCAYCVGIARWIAPWEWADRVRWLRRAAVLQALGAIGLAAFVAAAGVWGSDVAPRAGGATFTIGGSEVDATILFGRSLPGVGPGVADAIAVVVLLPWAAGALAMAHQNRAIARRLRAGTIAPLPVGAPSGEADGAARP